MPHMESDMFERDKKNTETIGSQDTAYGESGNRTGSTGSRAASRSGDVAVIGSSIRIKGDLCGDEDLRIEGNVSGTVTLKNSALTIGKGGIIKAGVYAKSIAVDGETTGDLHATECVSIHANARVKGNIIAPRVSIVEGAHFQGSIEMDKEAVEKALGESPTSAPKTTATAKKTADTSTAAGQPLNEASKIASPQAKSA